MEKSYRSGYLKVDDIHSIYFECYGTYAAKSVLIFHGGPGYGCDLDMLEPFDLHKWNIVMFDQRGCGRSIPKGCLIKNNTQLLIEDVKKLADYLGIHKFTIKGESWGATLALLFAEKYPEYVSSMILTGIFLGDNEGTLIGKNGGFKKYYPDLWEEYIYLLPDDKRKTPYNSYFNYLMNGTPEEKYKYARELIFIELMMELPTPDVERANAICDELDVYNIAKIEAYYTLNDFFVKPNQIIDNAYLLSEILISLIQGRHDLIVPIYSAWNLSKHLNKCSLHIAELGGHSDLSKGTDVIIKNVVNKHLEFLC